MLGARKDPFEPAPVKKKKATSPKAKQASTDKPDADREQELRADDDVGRRRVERPVGAAGHRAVGSGSPLRAR